MIVVERSDERESKKQQNNFPGHSILIKKMVDNRIAAKTVSHTPLLYISVQIRSQ